MGDTGATGLVGTALVAKLLALGHSVRVLTRDAVKARGKLRQPCDYHNESEWSKAIQEATAVVNLAGMLPIPYTLPSSAIHAGQTALQMGCHGRLQLGRWIFSRTYTNALCRRAHLNPMDIVCQAGDQTFPD